MILKVIHAAIGWIWLANRPDWVRNRQCNSWVLSPGCRLLLGRLLLCSIVKIIAIAQQMESILSWQKTFDARKVLNVIFRPRKLDLLFRISYLLICVLASLIVTIPNATYPRKIYCATAIESGRVCLESDDSWGGSFKGSGRWSETINLSWSYCRLLIVWIVVIHDRSSGTGFKVLRKH